LCLIKLHLVYYKDDGRVVLKVDVAMEPSLTIKEAHGTAVKFRELIESSLPGIADVDVDLELDEQGNDDELEVKDTRI
jgi:divalent metal cation (Fe/Co/Zn/Cd) transporter